MIRVTGFTLSSSYGRGKIVISCACDEPVVICIVLRGGCGAGCGGDGGGDGCVCEDVCEGCCVCVGVCCETSSG